MTLLKYLGPKGRNVVLDRGYSAPIITNDGVTIAREVELDDLIEDMGARIVREGATKANDLAGDGTTTATVLAGAMINEGLKLINEGKNPVLIRRGIERIRTCNKTITKQARLLKTDKEIENAARSSANSDKVGKLILQAIQKVGKQV